MSNPKKPLSLNGRSIHPDTFTVLPTDKSSKEWEGLEGYEPAGPRPSSRPIDLTTSNDPLERLRSEQISGEFTGPTNFPRNLGNSDHLANLQELIEHVARVTGTGLTRGTDLPKYRTFSPQDAVNTPRSQFISRIKEHNKALVDLAYNHVKNAAVSHKISSDMGVTSPFGSANKGMHNAADLITEAAQGIEQHNKMVATSQTYPEGHPNYDEERVSQDSIPTSDRIKDIAYLGLAHTHAERYEDSVSE
jgi:hypothetical protein